MIRRWTILVAVMLSGCKGTAPAAPNDDAPSAVPAPETVPASADAPVEGEPCCSADPAPSPDPVAAATPASLYAECLDRVEQPESGGECTSDADCASTGCGGEICTTKAAAADVMSTCEVRPCFAVLDTCGCVEGRCAWSLKAEIPPQRQILLPQ